MTKEIAILIIIQITLYAFLVWQLTIYIKRKRLEWNERRDFLKKVKDACIISTKSGIKVQSQGEKKIADWLYDHNIEFLYDTPMKAPGWRLPLRPDFYLKKYKTVIEFLGLMGDFTYANKSTRKIGTYWQMNLNIICIYPEDIEKIDTKLSKLLQTKIKEYLSYKTVYMGE